MKTIVALVAKHLGLRYFLVVRQATLFNPKIKTYGFKGNTDSSDDKCKERRNWIPHAFCRRNC